MLSKINFIVGSLTIINGQGPVCKVASATDPIVPNFRYENKDYVQQLDKHTDIAPLLCHAFLGNEIFDFRRMDRYMRDTGAALFESAGPGA